MDPLSITAGALGITDFALSRFSELYTLIKDLAGAKEGLDRVVSFLEGIQSPLDALKDIKIPNQAVLADAQESLKKAGLAEVVNRCSEECAGFTKKLKKWTRHSQDGELSKRDRFSIGVRHKEEIKTLHDTVESCQGLVQLSIGTAQLLIQASTASMSKDGQEKTSQKLQEMTAQAAEHYQRTIQAIKDAQTRKEELEIEPDDEDEADEYQRGKDVDALARRIAWLKLDKKSANAIAQMSSQDISGVKTDGFSKAWVGMTESANGKVNKKMNNIKTTDHSIAQVGVMGNPDADFWKIAPGQS